MGAKKEIQTAQEIIDEHLNGEALTEEMCREMAESLPNRAWIQEWSQKKGHRIYFECCGRHITDENEPEMREILLQDRHHREKESVPAAGNGWNILSSATSAEAILWRSITHGIAEA